MATMSGIYAIRNNITNQMYVGSAISFNRRWAKHQHELRNKVHHATPLQASYNKHGVSVFEYEIIEYVDDKSNLLAREQVWLDFFKPKYNVCKIATSALGVKRTDEAKLKMSIAQTGKKHSTETILKRSVALKGHIVTDETRAKISASHKGIRPSDESRVKMSLAKKGKKHSAETILKRKISIKAMLDARKGLI
jgi:group I intron endonuclease